MSNFGGAFGVFIIIIVTLAQLAGNSKRNKNKGGKWAEKDGPRNDLDLLKKPEERTTSKSENKPSWTKLAKKQLKIKGAKSDAAGKIAAEDSAPSFEVDSHHDSDVQGFDVK